MTEGQWSLLGQSLGAKGVKIGPGQQRKDAKECERLGFVTLNKSKTRALATKAGAWLWRKQRGAFVGQGED